MASRTDHERWIAQRMYHIESSGIRKVFELARSLKDPVNLSIGQPEFDVPEPIKSAAHAAIERGANAYTVTQGIAELLSKIQADVDATYRHADREVFVTSGTSGGLMLALCCTVNPGDEVIVFDPHFVMYTHLVTLAGGNTVFIDTYPDFSIDVDRVRAALTPRTKAILVNSPANPTGRVYPREVLRDLAQLAAEHGVLLMSDEVYRVFCYDQPFASPAEFSEDVLVFDGFSKAYGMTGWRLGFAHGPRRIIEQMIKLQQFTFVCAPSMVQHAGVAAWD
jgi:aspartate/methionine/tyrosine aminotransferase